MRGELTFPGIVSDPGALAQSISELTHLKHAISLNEVEGLRFLSGEQAAHGQNSGRAGSWEPMGRSAKQLPTF